MRTLQLVFNKAGPAEGATPATSFDVLYDFSLLGHSCESPRCSHLVFRDMLNKTSDKVLLALGNMYSSKFNGKMSIVYGLIYVHDGAAV